MSKKNEAAFDGVVDDDDDSDSEDTTTNESTDTTNEANKNQSTANTQKDTDGTTSSQDSTDETEPKYSPAFSYDEVDQKPLYIRSGFWDVIEDLRLYTEVALREEHDIRNAQTREIDEAILSLLEDELQEQSIADEVVRKRKNTD